MLVRLFYKTSKKTSRAQNITGEIAKQRHARIHARRTAPAGPTPRTQTTRPQPANAKHPATQPACTDRCTPRTDTCVTVSVTMVTVSVTKSAQLFGGTSSCLAKRSRWSGSMVRCVFYLLSLNTSGAHREPRREPLGRSRGRGSGRRLRLYFLVTLQNEV